MPKLRLTIAKSEEYSKEKFPTNPSLSVDLQRGKDRVVEMNILSEPLPPTTVITPGALGDVDIGDPFLTFQDLRPGIYTVEITGRTRLDENGEPEEHTAVYNTVLLFGEKSIPIPWKDLCSKTPTAAPTEREIGPQPAPTPGPGGGQATQ